MFSFIIFFHILSFSFHFLFLFLFVGCSRSEFFLCLNFVTISLDSSHVKKLFLGPWAHLGWYPFGHSFPFFPTFFSPVCCLALPVVCQLVTTWLSVKIRLRVVYGGRRVGQVLPSYQNRQISALDETADAPQSSLLSLLSSSCLVFLSFVLSCLLMSSLFVLFRLLLFRLHFSLCLCLVSLSLFVSVSLCPPLSLSPCDVVCHVALCCVVLGLVVRCGVWCVTLWKTSCVRPKRPRVYVQNAPVYTGTTST